MTALRWAVLALICAMAALWMRSLASIPPPAPLVAPAGVTLVRQCPDPGRAWCGGDTWSIEQYAADGHYRDDGSIPLTFQGDHLR